MTRFFLLGWLSFSSLAWAQISPFVAADRADYETLEKLEAYGCTLPRLRGFRPQSHFDLRSSLLVNEDAPCEAPEWLLYEREAFTNPGAPGLLRVQPLFLYQDAVALQGLEASVTPLLPLRAARPTVSGANLYLEITAGGEGAGTGGIAVSATPGWTLGFQNYQSFHGLFYLQEAYLKAGYDEAELTVGRVFRKFGEAKHGDLAVSLASAPLDSIQFAVRPHVNEGALSFLGPFTFETYLARLGNSSYVNNSLLWVVGVGFQPASWLEVDLQTRNQFGGDSVPGPAISDLLSMLAYQDSPGLDKIRHRSFTASLSSWMPSHFAKVYAQADFDSLNGFSTWFANDVSVLAGIYFPKLAGFDFRAEYVNTVPGAFQNSAFQQGFVSQGAPLGSPLGADAQAFYFDVGFPLVAGWRLGASFGYETRFESASGNQSPENRDLLGAEFSRRWEKLALSGQIVCALIYNENYVPSNNIETCGGQAQLSYLF